MKTKLSILAIAVLAALPMYGQSFNPHRGQDATPPTVEKPAPQQPKEEPKEQPKLAQPVLYIDVEFAGKSEKLDSTAEVFVNQIADGLSQAFDLKGGHVPKDESGFELRVYVIEKEGVGDFITTLLLIKPSDKSDLYAFIGGDALLTTSADAEKDGLDEFEDVRNGLEKFLDEYSDDHGSH